MNTTSIILWLAAFFTAAPAAWSATTIVVESDDLLFGEQRISNPGIPIISDNGEIAFAGTLHNENGIRSGSGIFMANASPGNVRQVINEDDPSPDFNGYFDSFNPQHSLVINESGEIAFPAVFTGTLGAGTDILAVFRTDSSSNLTQIMRMGDRLPGSTNRIRSLGGNVRINKSGDVGIITDTPYTTSSFYVKSGTNFSRIVRYGDPNPFGEGTLVLNFTEFALNANGQVLFVARNNVVRWGYYLGQSGSTNLTLIVQDGDPLPAGSGQFNNISFVEPTFNNSGHVAFVSRSLTGTDLGAADNAGVFRASSSGSAQIARKGDFVPGGNGRFLDFANDIALNDGGEVLFTAAITGAGGGSVSGVYLGNGTELTLIARTGDSAPGGGNFQVVEGAALNNRGQAVFAASITGAGAATSGLFFYDPALGIFPIIRRGDNIPGNGAVSGFAFLPSFGLAGMQNSGLNNNGDVTYRATANEYAIAIWSSAGLANNRAPVAADGGFVTQTSQGQTLQITVSNLLSVVSDPDGDILTIASITNSTSQGRPLTFSQSNQRYTYSPSAGFVGVDHFSYVVKDEIGATVSVQGTINVLPPNNPPIATNFSVIFIRGQPLTVSFEEILESATDPDGDTLTIVGFASVTTNGKAVSQTSDSFIILEPFSLGSFWCAIGDGRGGQTLINIYFTEENGLVTDGIGRFRRTADEVSFYITSPGATWRIERSEDPKGPWTEIGQVSTGTGRRGGTVEFKDPNPPVGRAFYRGRR